MLPTKFWCQPCFLIDRDEMSNLHRRHSIDASYQVSVVAMFVNRSGQNEHSSQRTFHRYFLPSFGSFGQAVSEEKIFKNQPIRNKNCLWWPCLLMDQDKMSNLHRGPSINASYHVSVHLAKRFQRRRFFQKSTNQKQKLSVEAMFVYGSPSDDKSSHCFWQGELTRGSVG